MWITLTVDNVVTKLSGPELAAMQSAALKPAQTDPLPEVIDQVVLEIRGFVRACARNLPLGADGTIPDELKGAAISRIRFELATRLPVQSLMTQDRRDANKAALDLLARVAECGFLIVAPTSPATEEVPAPTPRWSSRKKQYGRRQQDGV